MPKDVFISYSQDDKVWAEKVCAQLEEAGIGCWIAPRDIAPGVTWPAAITGAIRECRLMVIIFSTHANQSPHMAREIEVADNRHVPILPVRVEDVAPAGDMEYFLSNRQWYDFRGGIVERQVKPLPEVVSSLLGGAPEQAGAPSLGPAVPSGGAPAARPGTRRGAGIWIAAGAGVVILGAGVWYAIGSRQARVSAPPPEAYVAQQVPGEAKAGGPAAERRQEARQEAVAARREERKLERKEELARAAAPASPVEAAPVPAASAPARPPAAGPATDVFAGRWRAQVKYSWGASHNEVFDFKVDQNEVFGTATYVGGPRGILDGRIEGNRITFTTRSQTLLGDKNYEEKHQYRGRLSGNTIEFILQTDSGYDSRPPETFTATRIEPGSPEPSR